MIGDRSAASYANEVLAMLEPQFARELARYEHLVPGGYNDMSDRFAVLLPYLEAHDPGAADAAATIYRSIGQLRRMSADMDPVSS